MRGTKRTKSEKRRYEVIDRDSGEVIPAVTWVRKKWDGENFFMGFQDPFAEIAKKRFGAEVTNVLLFILGRVDYDNLIKTPQVEIARELGMKKQNVSRAVATLVGEKILLVDEAHSKYKRQLRLNDRYAWKGKLRHLSGRKRTFKKKNGGKAD